MSVNKLFLSSSTIIYLEAGREGTDSAEKASTESHSGRSSEGLSNKTLHSIW